MAEPSVKTIRALIKSSIIIIGTSQYFFLIIRNAKKLLDYGLNLKTGGYKVEDMNKKYWKKGKHSYS